MSNESMKGMLNAIIPQTLDSIIKENKQDLRFEYVQPDEMGDLEKELPSSPIKGVLYDAFLYKRIITLSVKEPISLVGFDKSSGSSIPWHTSTVIAYDPLSNIIFTKSGSLYQVKNFIEGEASSDLLLLICAVSHREGWGNYFGISHIFY